jgi:hypothetical protein
MRSKAEKPWVTEAWTVSMSACAHLMIQDPGGLLLRAERDAFPYQLRLVASGRIALEQEFGP